MRITAIALLISLAWTLFSWLTELEGTNTTHPTTLGLAVVGAGTLTAYAWLQRLDASRRLSPPVKQAFEAVATRYERAAAEVAEETAREAADPYAA